MPMDTIRIELVYAEPARVWLKPLALPQGSTVGDAIAASDFSSQFPDYPMQELKVGVYGQLCDTERLLSDSDRVEIYRPLVFDPMESRRRRALHRKAFMTKSKNRPRRRKVRIAAGLIPADRESTT
ncbi:RnfH family protein [Parapusillimonas sp. JC17]|uniref:RnfH family protein n=1 Tax=Parapusillimonas sp. JC17 TaxID=3445768 RepID=UPI003F9EBAC3